MPIYEYLCDSCGDEFEVIVLGGNEPKRCTYCGEITITKLVSACGFVSNTSNSLGKDDYATSDTSSASCGSCTASSCATCK